MEKVVNDLEKILKSDYIQNADLVIGQKIQELHSLASRGYSQVKFDIEPICLQLIPANQRKLSTINATYVGRLLALCYEERTHPETWKAISVLSDEIRKNSFQAIIMLGILAKSVGDQFRYSLPRLVYHILDNINSYSSEQLVFICQCFRRLIKGTGIFLNSECDEMVMYLFKGISSFKDENEDAQIECIKSYPSLYKIIGYSFKKLIEPFESIISTKSTKLRFFVAKTMAKLLFYQGTIVQKNELGQIIPLDPKKPFKFCFNVLLDYAKKEENIPTICHILMIWIRFMNISYVTEYIPLFVKFVLSTVNYNLPLPIACTFSRTVFKAITSVVGSTYEPLCCHYIFEDSRKSGFSTTNTMLTLDTLINFRASNKTITKAAKTFYPLLSTPDRDIVKMVSSFFVVVGRRDPKSSQILVDSFLEWLTSDDVKPIEIFGFSRGAATLLMTCVSINQESVQQYCDLCRKWLHETIEVNDPRFSAALLLCSAIFKRSPKDFPMQLLLVAFRALPRFFRNGEKITEENKYLLRPMKYSSILIQQVIISNIPTIASLYPTIQQCAIVLSHNSSVLSSPTLLALWNSIKICKTAWHISLPQSMMNAGPVILTRFYNPKENTKDYGMRESHDELDQAEMLYCTNLPQQYNTIVTNKLETIYTLLVADVRTSMRDELVKVVLRDYSSWAILAANPLKKSTVAQLFSPYEEQDLVFFQLRLTLLRAIATKPHIGTFIRPDGLKVLFSFQGHDTKTTRLLGAAIAAYVNIDPSKYDDLLDIIENPKTSGSLAAAAISELKFTGEREIEAIRCLLALQRLIISDQHPLEFFALIHLIELDIVPLDFVQQTVTTVEEALYSDALIKPENVYYLACCIDAISRVDHKHAKTAEQNNEKIKRSENSQYAKERERMAYAILHLPFNQTLNTLLAVQLLPEELNYPIDFAFTIEKPRPLLEAHAKQLHSMQDIMMLLDILQQGPSPIAKRKLQERLFGYKVISFWLTLAKQILIKGWVPFANCNTKITPSVPVINVVVSILDMMAQMLSRMYPRNSDRLKDLLVYTASVLENKDTDSHKCVYHLMTNFINMFKRIKHQQVNLIYFNQPQNQNQSNQSEEFVSALVNYENIFQDVFRKAFERINEVSASITFILSYFSYLYESKKGNASDPLLSEAENIISNELPRMQSGDRGNFIRLAGGVMLIIGKPMKGIVNVFTEKTNDFIVEVIRQTKRASSLKNEVYSTITTYIKIVDNFPLERPLLLCLLWEMDVYGFNDSMLKLFTNLFVRRANQEANSSTPFMKDLITYSLIAVGRSSYFKKESRSLTLTECSLPLYLQVIASRIPIFQTLSLDEKEKWSDEWETVWRYTLTLSLTRKPSFVALGLLIRCSPLSLLVELCSSIVFNIMDNETEECGSVLFLLFTRVSFKQGSELLIDNILYNVIRSMKTKDSAKFHVIIQAFRSMQRSYNFTCLNDIAQLTSFFFIPNGVKFLGNLLCDVRTINYGLNILRLGIADQIFRSELEPIHIDIIIDLLIVSTNIIHKYCPNDVWDKELIKFTIGNIVNMNKQRNTNQIRHLCALIKIIKPEIVSQFMQQSKNLSQVISLLCDDENTKDSSFSFF